MTQDEKANVVVILGAMLTLLILGIFSSFEATNKAVLECIKESSTVEIAKICKDES